MTLDELEKQIHLVVDPHLAGIVRALIGVARAATELFDKYDPCVSEIDNTLFTPLQKLGEVLNESD